jgi:hypothetical protein
VYLIVIAMTKFLKKKTKALNPNFYPKIFHVWEKENLPLTKGCKIFKKESKTLPKGSFKNINKIK